MITKTDLEIEVGSRFKKPKIVKLSLMRTLLFWAVAPLFFAIASYPCTITLLGVESLSYSLEKVESYRKFF